MGFIFQVQLPLDEAIEPETDCGTRRGLFFRCVLDLLSGLRLRSTVFPLIIDERTKLTLVDLYGELHRKSSQGLSIYC